MRRRAACLQLLALLLCCAATAADVQPVLRLAANYWEPYTGAELPGKGLAAEIVATALQRAGYATAIDIMPWSRVLSNAYNGQSDGVVAIWPTAQRRARILYSDSYLSNELHLFFLRPELGDRSSMDALTGLRIGVMRGYDYSDNFLLHDNFQVLPVDRVVQNLLKLSVDRIDMLLEDKRIVAYNLRHRSDELRGLPPLRHSATPLLTLPLHFGMSRRHPQAEQVIAAFNAQLARMRKDGTLAAILRRFDEAQPIKFTVGN
ncbi:substrate-binding periplasmic protein [Pseudoduganella aquatica]|uniref:substrate-binding periplasmic protein n=1 Tax=Pseudoduganella aquatica TaxID=2660641 RepID=UPI001E2CCC4B|nr:transporter substrate-binding domain-containing protein [Pseudoduganella aquatica]